MLNRLVEILGGIIILGFAGAVLILGWQQRPGTGASGYELLANFSDANGVQPGTLVEIAGVSIGRVTKVVLSDSYFARVHMQIDEGVSLPEEAELAWRQSDLLGAPRLSVIIFDVAEPYFVKDDFFSSVDHADNFLLNLA